MNFVATKHAKWTPSKFFAVCSGNFAPDNYKTYLVEIPGTKDYTLRLKKDELGIVVYPSKFKRSNIANEVSPCDKRQVCKLELEYNCMDSCVITLKHVSDEQA